MELQLPSLLCSQSDVVKGHKVSEMVKIDAQQCKDGRSSMMSQGMAQNQGNCYTRPVHDKDESMRDLLRSALLSNENMRLFMHENALNAVIDAFDVHYFEDAGDIICQGHGGDGLYVIASGHVDIYVAKPDFHGNLNPDDKGTKVATYGPGTLFGELALMHTAPQEATVTTCGQVCTFVLDALDYEMLIRQQGSSHYAKYEGWLSNVDVLKPFNRLELATLTDVMDTRYFDGGEIIVQQGCVGDKFYILKNGNAAAYIDGDEGQKLIKSYENQGDYFGDIVCIPSAPRTVTVQAVGDGCTIAILTAADFTASFGPIADTLRQQIVC